ncbi:MAG TPA: phage holin family protein [Allosphingosinicella sp.]|nr:phage holin family protein [Allosphingosinicella sp.]
MTPRDAPIAGSEEPLILNPSRQTSQAPGGDNVVDLLKELAGQGSHLAEQQLALLKAEIRESTTDMKVAVGSMAGAAVVGIAGLGVTLMGIAYLLGDAIDNLGLATLIVGLATLALGYVLYRAGASKMSATHLAPDRTQRTLNRAPEVARGTLHTEQR